MILTKRIYEQEPQAPTLRVLTETSLHSQRDMSSALARGFGNR
jgi:hypothetical protein